MTLDEMINDIIIYKYAILQRFHPGNPEAFCTYFFLELLVRFAAFERKCLVPQGAL
jgi:hypothetical protein